MVVVNPEWDEFLSDKELQDEYAYTMGVFDLSPFVMKYGIDKVANDLVQCAATMMETRTYGPDYD